MSSVLESGDHDTFFKDHRRHRLAVEKQLSMLDNHQSSHHEESLMTYGEALYEFCFFKRRLRTFKLSTKNQGFYQQANGIVDAMFKTEEMIFKDEFFRADFVGK